MAAPKKDVEPIRIKPIEFNRVEVVVVGDTVVVSHRMGETAIDKLNESTREQKFKGKKQPRVIEREYAEATYFMPDGATPAVPAFWFKASMINACSFIEGINKTLVRAAVFVEGEMLPISAERRMRMDVVRLQGFAKPAQTRYRPEYFPWSVTLPIRYRPDLIDVSDICNLLNHAGFSVGVGEDRPQKRGGQWGLFHVASEEEKRSLAGNGAKKRKAA